MLRLSPAFSADDHRLVSRLAIEPGANMTLLYDALVEACSAFSGDMARRVIFVVSDGTDTSSVASPRTVLQRAAEADVAIHAVGLASRYVERGRPVVRMPDAILRELAEDTGGGYVYAGTGRDYARLFGAMIEQLRQQYMLGFTPARADGRVHTLMVTTRRPDVTIRARKHYLAPLP
jgi:VWFA-related protein